jgi:hypothetical protein
VILLSALTGCASRTETYCSTLRGDKATLQGLAAKADKPGSDVIGQSLDIFSDLHDKAPSDLTDEWATFESAWRGLDHALSEAGVSPQQFRDGKKPAGVSTSQYAAIQRAAERFRSQRVVAAAEGIQQQAQDVCKVNLGGSGLGM